MLESLADGSATFVQFFAFTYETIFFVDVVWATPGYILSCKLFDTHVRSAEPTFLGAWTELTCLRYRGQNRWQSVAVLCLLVVCRHGSAMQLCGRCCGSLGAAASYRQVAGLAACRRSAKVPAPNRSRMSLPRCVVCVHRLGCRPSLLPTFCAQRTRRVLHLPQP